MVNSSELLLSDLVGLCHFAGERFDLVQAGGGNASARLDDGSLWVKASGISLSEVTVDRGLCELDGTRLLSLMEKLEELERQTIGSLPGKLSGTSAEHRLETLANEGVRDARRSTSARPSIETLLHALLGPFTLHTHPPLVTGVVCRLDWQDRLKQIFPEAFYVEYTTPGAWLALALARELRSRSWHREEPAIVFLQNHGLIVAAARAEEVVKLTDAVLDTLAKELGADWPPYRLTNSVSALVKQACGVVRSTYYCEDRSLLAVLAADFSLAVARPSCPDQAVYCGPAGLELRSLDHPEPVRQFAERFGQPPHIVVFEGHLFLIAANIKKCRELEEVLKAHVLTLSTANKAAVNYLPDDEIAHLLGWEAEKYRQNL